MKSIFFISILTDYITSMKEYHCVHCYLCLGAREGFILEIITFPSKGRGHDLRETWSQLEIWVVRSKWSHCNLFFPGGA